MSLFACSKCGCVDNTATSRYWFREIKDGKFVGPALCSLCDPAVGKWHGLFPREQPTKQELDSRGMKNPDGTDRGTR